MAKSQGLLMDLDLPKNASDPYLLSLLQSHIFSHKESPGKIFYFVNTMIDSSQRIEYDFRK